MMRSISYSRYFSTATPTQTGSTAKPIGLMTSLTARSQARPDDEISRRPSLRPSSQDHERLAIYHELTAPPDCTEVPQ
jgi:hypothetical protein